MKPIIKGGQWKNSEDEVLKAAVMKYGMNNWSRVASLLNRKTARQCRARWFEWLDPSVKKTPWSQAEDEKLLHAVKVFPTQWKTIAPIVGRTAYQCLARYNELLDIASGNTPIAPSDDPRLPRPGEIDAQPETRPAKADAVDLDDDEREMLAEARARLANTKGKKAKRKAREKQLEQKRRSVMLQRRKEFEDAGITLRNRKGKTNQPDYNAFIPNKLEPLPGAHDTSNEQTLSEEKAKTFKRLQEIEAAKEKFRQQKLKVDERRMLKKLHQSIDKVANSVSAVFSTKQRSALTLPTPHATDQELKMIAAAAQKQESSGFFSSSLSEAAAGTSQLVESTIRMDNRTVATTLGTNLKAGTSQSTNSLFPRKLETRGDTPEPVDIAKLLGDVNLYIGSRYKIDIQTDNIKHDANDSRAIPAERVNAVQLERHLTQLKTVHSRLEVFENLMPRPKDLPSTVEGIVELMEAGCRPASEIESAINWRMAELYLADQIFLNVSEYEDILSSNDPDNTKRVENLKKAFLMHANATASTQNIRLLKQAGDELEASIQALEEAVGENEMDLGPMFREIAGHIPAYQSRDQKICVWDDDTKSHRIVNSDDRLVESEMARQVHKLKSRTKALEKQQQRLTKKIEKLSSGYTAKTAETLRSLDFIYDYELDLHRVTVTPTLPETKLPIASFSP